MATVTRRIKEIKQPKGGYVKPSEFDIITFDDNLILNDSENVHGSIIGMVVDYLTRFLIGGDAWAAFRISLKGAKVAERFGIKGAIDVAVKFLNNIIGVDDKSIINACKLVTFDVWYRNVASAKTAKGYKETNPDKGTIENIKILIERSVRFFDKYGPIIKDGFTFEPDCDSMDEYIENAEFKKGNYGGYTATVDKGDGDFLTDDTLWDFKVSRAKPTNKHTLQLLMYWIMGQHSGQYIFKDITKLGIYNPRFNAAYLIEVKNISEDVIKAVENDVICY